MVKPSLEQSKGIFISDKAKVFIEWDTKGGQMTCRQVAIYHIVARNPGLTVGAIAHALNCPKPSVTRAVDKLQSLKLVQRVSNPDDYRLTMVYPRKTK